MRHPLLAIALAALLGGVAAADAVGQKPHRNERSLSDMCDILLEHAPADAPRFEDYPVAAETVRPAPVNLKGNPEARRFRTMLREGAADGPNFAGHFTIVDWGCGTSCVNWAVVDATTGKVHFDPATEVVSAVHVFTDQSLNFRQDSRLLVVLGAPHEDEKREGITYLLWDGKGFKRLAFVPYATLCGGKTPG
jgi:hypothetical protein